MRFLIDRSSVALGDDIVRYTLRKPVGSRREALEALGRRPYLSQ